MNNYSTALENIFPVLRNICKGAKDSGKKPVIYIPGNAGKIDYFEKVLFTNAEKVTGGVDAYVFQALALGSASGWADAVRQGVTPVTPFIGPGVRSLVNNGLAENIRLHLSQVHRLYEGRWRPDVAFAHVSLPDHHGRVTLGLNAGLDISAVKSAKTKIAVINSNVPRFAIGQHYDPLSRRTIEYGCSMKLSEFDLIVEIDEPLFEHVMSPKDEDVSNGIADTIISILASEEKVDNLSCTLQLGIGAIPNALAKKLAEKNLSIEGVWSEMFSDGVLNLYRKGLIKKTGGENLRDHIVVGFVLGSKDLYREMQENSSFVVVPQQVVNDPSMIKLNDRMVSINSAIAVSLQGQVVASTIGKKHHSDVGGQFDFAQGASWSRNGVSIIALPSEVMSKQGDAKSRIVALHESGAHHTISADLPVIVATEHGHADLRGLTDRDRTYAMLTVAHPKYRAELEREIMLLPQMQGVGVIPPRIVLLASGKRVIVRVATREDIPKVRDYINNFSDRDRHSRYMGSVSLNFLTSDKRLTEWYDSGLDYKKHAAFLVEEGFHIIGVAHAFLDKEDGSYEISFSRRSGREGENIGLHLMSMLIDWAEEKEVSCLKAVTFRSNNPMRKLFKMFGFEESRDEDDHANVRYHAYVENLVTLRDSVRV